MNTDILKLSATEVLKIIKSGQISTLTLTELCLEKAKQNRLNEFLLILEDRARERARESYERVRSGNCRKLEGLPVALKDVFCVKGHETTAASRILEGFKPPYDATVVKLLEDEGAIIIGKTNLDEFAMGSSGEHSAFGSTKNPLDLTRTPGGSSSGSAACVADHTVYASLGTDTGGSVRLPASFCGLVGFKPTYGAISRHGVIPFASSFDHPAIFTRTIEDARLMAAVLAKKCDLDSNSIETIFDNDQLTLRPKFAYIPEQIETLPAMVRTVFHQILDLLQKRGIIAEAVSMPEINDCLKLYYTITPAEAFSNLAKYDCLRFGAKVEANNIEEGYVKARNLFGSEVKKRLILGTDILYNRMEDFNKAHKYRKSLISIFDNLLNKFDAILSPTARNIAFKLGAMQSSEEEYSQDVLTVLANVIQAPAISIPYGSSEGMPLGLTIMSGRRKDSRALQIAEYLEKLLKEKHD